MNQFLSKCSRCVFFDTEMYLIGNYCQECYFIPIPVNNYPDTKQYKISRLYNQREKVQLHIDNMHKIYNDSDVREYLESCIKRIDLKIEEVNNQ